MYYRPLLLFSTAIVLCASARAMADVVIITNATRRPVEFAVMPPEGSADRMSVDAGALVSVPTLGRLFVAFQAGDERLRYTLDVNSIYRFFSTEDGRLDLHLVGLGGEPAPRPLGVVTPETLRNLVTIPVKILVDEDERAARRIWEERLRRRVKNASDLLEKHCRVRLEVVAADEWNSNNRLKEFEKSLDEFEREVKPSPARLAIGFTSQYEIPKGRSHLGGTRGPLHAHILCREWAQHITEAERLEVLLHELGHVFGAVHSADGTSVMRPLLGDRKARLASFRIGFDPVNTLALNLFADELRGRNVRSVTEITPQTNRRLQQVYAALAKSLPEDPAAKHYLSMMGQAALIRLAPETRRVVQSITQAAKSNAALPPAALPPVDGAEAGKASRKEKDALLEFYLRQAAWAAKDLPREKAAPAFLLGLGIALDDSQLMLRNPQTRPLCQAVETPEQRADRMAILGEPTIHARADLAKHFLVSAYLTAIVGPRAAEAAGFAKELIDLNRTSGFSFIDLAANKAGIRFALAINRGQVSFDHLARQFAVEYYMPSIEGLPEGLAYADFQTEFGSADDQRYQQVLEDIDQRLADLPPYKMAVTPPAKIAPE